MKEVPHVKDFKRVKHYRQANKMRKDITHFGIALLLIFGLFLLNTGIVEISSAQASPDIAITSVIPSKTVVRLGDIADITVSVANQGAENATFSVAVYRDSIVLENKTVNDLASNQTMSLVFSWNTTDVSSEINVLSKKEKIYDIKAVAQTLSGETDTADNMLASANKIKVVSRYVAVIPERTMDPSFATGMNYTVSIITDYNGSDVWGWQITLTFNQAVLEVIDVRNGDLITKAKDPNAQFLPTYNNTIGAADIGAFFYYVPPDVPPTTSGPGTLTNVTFRVVGTGYSNITLEGESKLKAYDNATSEVVDVISDYIPDINHLLSGYFGNTEAGTVDVLVVSVTPSPTSVIQGSNVQISIVIQNLGTLTASFDVKAYFDYNPSFPSDNIIETKSSESLAAGADKTLVFAWDTKGVPEGDHTITAVISGVSGETNANNNRLDSAQKVTVKLVTVRPLPLTEIAIGVVVFLVVVSAILLILRRRRSHERARAWAEAEEES